MASASIPGDKFDQILGFGVTMSAANTLTFGRIAVGVTIFDYAAFIISRVEFLISQASMNELVAGADILTVAITGSSSVSDIFDVTNPSVYTQKVIYGGAQGAAANFRRDFAPFVNDYSSMEGGGLIVPAQDIFIGAQTAGFAAAATVTARVYYRVMKLQAADYLELAQRLRVLTT